LKIDSLAQKVLAGGRVDRAEALELYRHAPTHLLGHLADSIRLRKHPDRIVTYIIDRNVNYTNVCVARCNFCAFYRAVGSAEGYVLGFEEIFRKIDETIAVGGNQLLLQGGHNPDLPIAWYEDLFRAVKSRYPAFKLHALSPPEVLHISRLNQIPVPTVIERLVAAGLDSIPGGGAEILVDRVRKLLNCYGKATSDEWLGVMREAHRAGLRTTSTMMYGTCETDEERIEHLVRLRELQDETGGFTAFITWSYQPEHTERGGTEATGVDYLRTLALSRIVLDNFDNLQASWVTQGGKVGQLSLAYGANDMGSVMISSPNGATCTTTCSATPSSASAAFRGCWRWRPPASTEIPRCPKSSAITRLEAGARKNSAQPAIADRKSPNVRVHSGMGSADDRRTAAPRLGCHHQRSHR
jgi:cyclic dehypoxanthinyl futalosine synthase